jgi:hypothetical protein
MTKPFMRQVPGQKCHGQSAFEYTVIPCLLLVVSLGGLTLLGGNFNDLALNAKKTLKNQMTTREGAKKTLAQAVLPAPETLTSPVTAEELLTDTSEDLPETSGTTNSMAETVNTLGANGAISTVAQEISLLANELLAQKKLTATEYNLFIKLASQGYVLAGVNAQIEQAAKKSTSLAEFENAKITVNGQVYTVGSFATVTSSMDRTREFYIINPSPIPGDRSKDILQNFKDAANDVAYSLERNSPVFTQIDKLIREIFAIQVAADKSRKNILKAQDSLANLIKGTASQISTNSTVICTVGNGNGNGNGNNGNGNGNNSTATSCVVNDD